MDEKPIVGAGGEINKTACKIINFPASSSVETSIRIKSDAYYEKAYGCKHKSFILEYEKRIVRCEDCKTIIDPIEVLRQFADQERKLILEEERHKACVEEMKKIKSEWKFTTREKRRIQNAGDQAALIKREALWKESKDL